MHHGREVGRHKNLTHHHFNLASCVLLVNFFFVPPADDMCFVSISFLFPSFLATILPSAAQLSEKMIIISSDTHSSR